MKKERFVFKNTQQGLTIVEVLVAILMLGAVIVLAAGLLIPLRLSRDSNTETQALSYARSYIELVRQAWLDPNKYESSPTNTTINPVWPTAGTGSTDDLRLPTGWILTTGVAIRAVAGRYSSANTAFASTTNLNRYNDTLRDVTITVTPDNGGKAVAVTTVIALTNP